MAFIQPTTVKDFPINFAAGITVFLVALPLCLGIALASEAPLFSGVLTGVIGGLAVGFVSGSHLSISGPAAGLITIVLAGVAKLGGSFEAFLAAVVIAGVIQMLMGFLGLGKLARFVPSSVIFGMMSAIGIIIISKQVPYLVGYEKEAFGSLAFQQADGNNTLTALQAMLSKIHSGAATIGIACFVLFWVAAKLQNRSETAFVKRLPIGLFIVFAGLIMNQIFSALAPSLVVGQEHLVALPMLGGEGESSLLTYPDVNAFLNPATYVVALTLSAVASLQSLLTVEAVDSMDPKHRHTDKNRELKAQGIGNILCGLFGALPMTSVIVRATANIQSGATHRTSTIIQGTFLLVGALVFPQYLNMVPLAALAAILIHIGLRLVNVQRSFQVMTRSLECGIPFITTIAVTFFSDLLVGIAAGLAAALVFIAYHILEDTFDHEETRDESGALHTTLSLAPYMSFLHKSDLKLALSKIPENSRLTVEAGSLKKVHHDVLSILRDFEATADKRNIDYKLNDLPQL